MYNYESRCPSTIFNVDFFTLNLKFCLFCEYKNRYTLSGFDYKNYPINMSEDWYIKLFVRFMKSEIEDHELQYYFIQHECDIGLNLPSGRIRAHDLCNTMRLDHRFYVFMEMMLGSKRCEWYDLNFMSNSSVSGCMDEDIMDLCQFHNDFLDPMFKDPIRDNPLRDSAQRLTEAGKLFRAAYGAFRFSYNFSKDNAEFDCFSSDHRVGEKGHYITGLISTNYRVCLGYWFRRMACDIVYDKCISDAYNEIVGRIMCSNMRNGCTFDSHAMPRFRFRNCPVEEDAANSDFESSLVNSGTYVPSNPAASYWHRENTTVEVFGYSEWFYQILVKGTHCPYQDSDELPVYQSICRGFFRKRENSYLDFLRAWFVPSNPFFQFKRAISGTMEQILWVPSREPSCTVGHMANHRNEVFLNYSIYGAGKDAACDKRWVNPDEAHRYRMGKIVEHEMVVTAVDECSDLGSVEESMQQFWLRKYRMFFDNEGFYGNHYRNTLPSPDTLKLKELYKFSDQFGIVLMHISELGGHGNTLSYLVTLFMIFQDCNKVISRLKYVAEKSPEKYDFKDVNMIRNAFREIPSLASLALLIHDSAQFNFGNEDVYTEHKLAWASLCLKYPKMLELGGFRSYEKSYGVPRDYKEFVKNFVNIRYKNVKYNERIPSHKACVDFGMKHNVDSSAISGLINDYTRNLRLKPFSYLPNIAIKMDNYILEKCDPSHPATLMVGYPTGCCQRLGGEADDVVRQNMWSPACETYGIRHLHSEPHDWLAISWVTIMTKGFVNFDSIESKNYREIYSKLYYELAKHLLTMPYAQAIMVAKTSYGCTKSCIDYWKENDMMARLFSERFDYLSFKDGYTEYSDIASAAWYGWTLLSSQDPYEPDHSKWEKFQVAQAFREHAPDYAESDTVLATFDEEY